MMQSLCVVRHVWKGTQKKQTACHVPAALPDVWHGISCKTLVLAEQQQKADLW